MKIKIVRIERKPTAKGSTMTAIFDDKDTRFSGFAPELMSLKEGDLINAEIEVKGKYNNILSAEVVEHSETPAPAAKPAYRQDSDDPTKRRSIERQTSLNAAVSIWSATNPHGITTGQVIEVAEEFYQWVSQGKMPPTAGKEASVTTETMKGAFKSSSAPVAKTEGTVGKATPIIDMVWLKESINTLQWSDVGKYLKQKYNVTGVTVTQMVNSLRPDQQKEFAGEVEDRLQMR